jgi:hypothetical protein
MIEDKYKNVTIKGSEFPDAPINNEVKISLSKEIIHEYIPVIEKLNLTKGMKLLCIIMAQKEGFYKGTRSYRYNNPGNIGNTDSGANQGFPNLMTGISQQVKYITKVSNGEHKAFPLNKKIVIKPYYSKEIAANQKSYGMSPYLAGYEFKYTGQLDQFVKIYSTGARGGNSYLNMILSFFKNHGIELTPQSTIQEIIKL